MDLLSGNKKTKDANKKAKVNPVPATAVGSTNQSAFAESTLEDERSKNAESSGASGAVSSAATTNAASTIVSTGKMRWHW